LFFFSAIFFFNTISFFISLVFGQQRGAIGNNAVRTDEHKDKALGQWEIEMQGLKTGQDPGKREKGPKVWTEP